MSYHMQGTDKSSLRGKVFTSIREAILDGTYKKGDVIRESAIAQQLGVSRTPVREAIRQLELEGLVESIPNKETIVSGITEEDVHDIFLIRSRLEGLAARKAAERITEDELKELEEVLALTSFYAEKHDANALKELDHRFHEVIYKATKSKTLNHMLSDFHHYIQKARKLSIATPGRAKKVVEEHQSIYEALVQKDGDAAERLMDEHVRKAANNMKID
ncbi:MAG: GntR family transcriptional regulator [Cellulosilyticaceae bacterium]